MVIRSLLAATAIGTLSLGGCTRGGEASNDGKAFLHNETGKSGLLVVVVHPDGHVLEDGALEEVYSFDTQWTNRERQCYVASDGSFEVRRAGGSVLAQHDFADRPVCEREEITVTSDGDFVWGNDEDDNSP